MTGHEETDSRERAFAEFRDSLAPLEASGKLRGVLLQYHPRLKKSPRGARRAARRRRAARAARPADRVPPPLVDDRGGAGATRSSFLEQHGLAYVSVDSPRTRASNVLPRIAAATHEVAYIRFHGRNWKTWNKKTKTSGERFDWLYSREDLEEWVEPIAQARRGGAARCTRCSTTTATTTRRGSAQVLRGLLDEAGIEATGGVEPAPANATLF